MFDQSTESERIQFGRVKQGLTPERMAEYEGMLDLVGIPRDLTGKLVLELFSGGSQSSFRDVVAKRGGNYLSVDLDDGNGSNHICGDVYQVVPGLAKKRPGEFDFVLMKCPPVWGRLYEEGLGGPFSPRSATEVHDWRDMPEMMGMLKQATRLVKPVGGNLIVIFGSMIDRDISAMYRGLLPDIGNDWQLYGVRTGKLKRVPKRDWRGNIVRREDRIPYYVNEPAKHMVLRHK